MNLKQMQVISPEMHGVLDYVTAGTLLAAPKLFRFDKLRGPAVRVPRIFGSMILGQAAMTDYRLGLLKVLPFNMHLALDYALGPFLALSPFIFGFSQRRRRAWLPHLLTGAFILLTTAMTRPQPQWQRDEQRLSRAMEREMAYGGREREQAFDQERQGRMPAGSGMD
jgi:hypothetical protein